VGFVSAAAHVAGHARGGRDPRMGVAIISGEASA